jgi:hypothetical protein
MQDDRKIETSRSPIRDRTHFPLVEKRISSFLQFQMGENSLQAHKLFFNICFASHRVDMLL